MFAKEKKEELVHKVDFEKIGPRILAAIDAGKDNLKALFGAEGLLFKTRVIVNASLNQVSARSGDSFLVEYDGVTYVVGDAINSIPNMDMSKATIEHKICIYSAIARMVPKHATVDLVVGIPILLYLNEEARLDFIAYLSQPTDQEWIEVKVNGELNRFKLGRIQVLPESAGYVFNNYEQCANRLTGVLDIGGLNINACIFDGFSPVYSSSFTLNKGGYHLVRDIQQRLIQRLGRDIQDYQMKHIIAKPKPSEAPIIESVVREYLESVLVEMKKKNWDLEGLNVVLTGGTSLLVSPYATDYIPNLELSDDPIFDNVKGFQLFASQVMEG